MRWHILTGEYPPQPGGVSDYTRLVARGLAAAGDRVDVWAPRCAHGDPVDAGVEVRRLPDRFGRRSLAAIADVLVEQRDERRILVQYVPHAFGWKALNVPFCLWLRRLRAESVWVMFHEVACPLDPHQSLRRNALALATRGMARLVVGAAERAFVSIPGWEPILRSLGAGTIPIEWLPVPSGVPTLDVSTARLRVRDRFPPGRALVGHFGTYGDLTLPLLSTALPQLVARAECDVLLLGRGSDRAIAELDRVHPALRGRVHASGELAPDEVSRHIGACDLLLQPYPDGVSSRRTSVMAALALGRPVVTTSGWLTEPLWSDSQAVVLVPAGDAGALAAAGAALLGDPERAARLGSRARALYQSRFDVRHTIDALRAPAGPTPALRAVS
jgi:glycosyltransferase involved in cell wall biosynthesis